VLGCCLASSWRAQATPDQNVRKENAGRRRGAHPALPRSADFQSAVSPSCTRLGVRCSTPTGRSRASRIANPRVQLCATGTVPSCARTLLPRPPTHLSELTFRFKPRRFEIASVIVMRLRPKHLSPLLRSLAAVTLLVWAVGQAFCFAHCTLGPSRSGSCHDSSLTSSQQEVGGGSCCPKNRDRSSGIVCVTLMKGALVGNSEVHSVEPDLHPLYELLPFSSILETTVPKSTTHCRQSFSSDWVFTPEVSLGPAHRTHAPPSHA